jgi:histidinol dehydrogenase
MRVVSGRAAASLIRRLGARNTQLSALEPRVRRIVNDVRRHGDRSLRTYAKRWDGLAANQPLRVPEAELKAAWHSLTSQLRKSLRQAAQNIRRFCLWQKPSAWTRRRAGISLGQLIRPLESAGCYVPGGRHPLVSTLLMTVIPAQVAGVKDIRAVPPRPSQEVLAAAAMSGTRVLPRRRGAIAALAYGTQVPARGQDRRSGACQVAPSPRRWLRSSAIDFLANPRRSSLSDSLQISLQPTLLLRRSMIRCTGLVYHDNAQVGARCGVKR